MPTITIYSQIGNDPGAAWDGNVQRRNIDESWATIHDNSVGNHFQATTNGTTFVQLACSTTVNWFRILSRGIVGMDTTVLDPGWTINDATLYLKGETKTNTYTNSVSTAWRLAIVKFTNPTSTLSEASYEYTRYSTTTLATASYSGFSTTVHNAFPIPPAEVGKGVVTYFAGRSNYDIDNSPPTWQSFADIRVNIWYADATGTADDPYLVVTYNAATPTFNQAIII